MCIFHWHSQQDLASTLISLSESTRRDFNNFYDEIAAKQSGNPSLPDKAHLMNILSLVKLQHSRSLVGGCTEILRASIFSTHTAHVLVYTGLQKGKWRGDKIREKEGSAIIALTEWGDESGKTEVRIGVGGKRGGEGSSSPG